MPSFKDGSIIFDSTDKENAWENAVNLINGDGNKKMCYLCKFVMEKENYWDDNKQDISWVIDFVNIKNWDKNKKSDNLIAVHYNCFSNIDRSKPNMKRQIDKVKSLLWKDQ